MIQGEEGWSEVEIWWYRVLWGRVVLGTFLIILSQECAANKGPVIVKKMGSIGSGIREEKRVKHDAINFLPNNNSSTKIP